jgi:O-acetyl-ADP-ribose deacetylase (regulator of RNase III)
MKLILTDLSTALCAQWRTVFAGAEGVEVHNGKFQEIIGSYDCFVSPANSFGLMDGGIDAEITEFFGVQLEERVQAEIWRLYRGEQPVGTCLMAPTGDARCPWLAHCPTMRVPMDVSWTNHAYAAFLAALTTASAHGIQTLACPGLGTHTGRIPPDVAARQMRYAYDLWSGPPVHATWDAPLEREWRSYGRSRLEFLKHRYPPGKD